MKLLTLLILFSSHIAAAESLCVAHRGNSSEHLENSMEAIISGYELGADVIEFDIHHTKDNVAIIMHDKTLNRTSKSKENKECSLNKKIGALNFLEIQENCVLQNGERIPTLEVALKYLKDKDVELFLEMKDKPGLQSLELVYQAYEKNPEKLHIISFKSKYLKAVKESPLNVLVEEGATLAHISSFSISAIFDFDGVISRLPRFSFIQKALNLAKFSGVFTVNDAEKMQKYIGWKTDYVITNYPAECLQIKRGLAQK